MNDWDFGTDLNNDNPDQANTNKGLRGWAESVQKKNDELSKQLADVLAFQKAYQMQSVFKDLNVPEAAAKLYKGDADPEAIKSWVTDVRTAFGIGTTDAPTDQPVTPVSPVLTPGQENLFQQLTAAGEAGRPSTGLEDAQRGVNQAGSVADLIANFQNNIR